MSNYRSTLKALGGTDPAAPASEPKPLPEAKAQKDLLVDRLIELDTQLSLPDGGTGSWKIWLELRPQLVAEKMRSTSTLRKLNRFIASLGAKHKLTKWATIRALLAVIDRLEESGAQLTADESDIIDEAAYLIDVAEASAQR